MRESELWSRLKDHLGEAYYLSWAEQQSLPGLDSMTVREALAAGIPCKTIWRAAWLALELPQRDW